MGFVESFGNPGAASAADGITNALTRKQEVQDAQMSRLLAIKQLDMQQTQQDLQLDKFAAEKENQRNRTEIARLQLGLGQKAQAQSEQQFAYKQSQDSMMLEREKARGEVALDLIRAFSDGELSDAEYEALGPKVEFMDANQIGQFMDVAQRYHQRKKQADADANAQKIHQTAAWLLDKQLATDVEVVAAQTRDTQEPGYFEQWVNERMSSHTKKLTASKANTSAYNAALDVVNTQEAQRNMDEDGRLAAAQLQSELETMLEADPSDSRIPFKIKQLKRLTLDKDERKKLEEYDASKGLAASMPPKDYLDALPMEEQKAWLRVKKGMDAGLGENYGEFQKKLGNQRLTDYVAKMGTYGVKVNPQLNTPADLATPDMLRFAFQEIKRMEPLLMRESMSNEQRNALIDHQLKVAGLEPSDEMRVLYSQWADGVPEAKEKVDRVLTTEEVQDRAIAIAKHRLSKKYGNDMAAERERLDRMAQDAARKNAELARVGGTPIEITGEDRNKLEEMNRLKMAAFQAGFDLYRKNLTVWDDYYKQGKTQEQKDWKAYTDRLWKDAGLTDKHRREWLQWAQQQPEYEAMHAYNEKWRNTAPNKRPAYGDGANAAAPAGTDYNPGFGGWKGGITPEAAAIGHGVAAVGGAIGSGLKAAAKDFATSTGALVGVAADAAATGVANVDVGNSPPESAKGVLRGAAQAAAAVADWTLNPFAPGKTELRNAVSYSAQGLKEVGIRSLVTIGKAEYDTIEGVRKWVNSEDNVKASMRSLLDEADQDKAWVDKLPSSIVKDIAKRAAETVNKSGKDYKGLSAVDATNVGIRAVGEAVAELLRGDKGAKIRELMGL